MKKRKIKISYNSPIVITFVIICFFALILNWVTVGRTNLLVFSVYKSSWLDPLTYVRLFGHVLGHASWEHFFGNMTLLLVVGPLLEEKYGSSNLLFLILNTALVTGLINMFFFPDVRLLGASGVVFAFILLSPFTSYREGEIPITLVLVAIIYIGKQVYDGLFLRDNVSNITHIIGGVVGAGLGFVMHKHKMNRY